MPAEGALQSSDALSVARHLSLQRTTSDAALRLRPIIASTPGRRSTRERTQACSRARVTQMSSLSNRFCEMLLNGRSILLS